MQDMGQRSRHRTSHAFGGRGGTALIGIVLGLSTVWPHPAAATVHKKTNDRADKLRRPSLVRRVAIPLGNCLAPDVIMRATIPRLTFSSSQPVTVSAVVRNEGTHACTYGGAGQRNQFIGPCGAFSLQVFSSNGAPVWPGPVAYSCPMIGPTLLAPKAEVEASGTWPKLLVTRNSTSPARVGRYRLFVDQKVSFTISLR
jgi:hypothetical protein